MKYYKYFPFHLIYLLIKKAKNIFYPARDVNKLLEVLVFIFFISYNSFAQQQTSGKTLLDTVVMVNTEGHSLKECLSELTETYGINFSYINDEIPLQKQIHCRIVQQPLKILLDTVCKQTNTKYFLVGTQIVLKNVELIASDTKDTTTMHPVQPEVKIDTVYQITRTETEDTYQMNKKYKKYFFSVFGKRRAPDSMVVVYSNGTKDTISTKEGAKKYRYVNRTYLYPRFSIGLYGGGGVAYRKLSGDDRYVTERNSSEHSIPNYIFGGQFTYYLKSVHIAFRSGLAYTNFGENGSYFEIIVIQPPQSQPGKPPTEKIIMHSYENRSNYLMLPLMAGYTFNVYNRIGLSVYSGLSIAFLVKNLSTFEEPESNGNPQTPPIWFKHNPFMHSYNNVSLAWPVQAELFYRINMRLHIFAKPEFNYFLTSIYTKNDLNTSRPYAFDCSVGINYFFKIH